MINGMPGPIGPFMSFFPSAPVVPKLYYESLSPEQRIRRICEALHRVCEYANQVGMQVDGIKALIEQLEAEFEQFKESGFLDYYEAQLQAWIDEHFADLIRYAIHQVYFGLTDDGYFCAYVPDSWSEIVFDTGMVYGRSDYGRLILRFDADGEGVIDNTYSYSLGARPSDFERLVADVENTTRRTDKAYATLFTNMDEEVPDADI